MDDMEFVYHECQGTIPIMVPTYPGSEKLKPITVCIDCEPHWHNYRYSSAAAFFAPEPLQSQPDASAKRETTEADDAN